MTEDPQPGAEIAEIHPPQHATIRLPEPGEVEPFGPHDECRVGDGFTTKPKP